MTRQVIEAKLPDCARSGEGFDELIKEYFLVPEDKDECRFYQAVSSMMRAFDRQKGHKAYLKQYKGKPVYLHIFQTDCINCIREMLIIKELNDKYNEKVQFVSLCVDPEKNDFQAFVKQYGKQFDWPMLYFNEQYDWLMSQGVETLPDYMFFGADGTLRMRYALAPEQVLPEFLLLNFPEEKEEDQNPLFYNRNKQ